MDLKIDLMYHLLPQLSNIEEMFIDRVHVVMKVYRLDKGRIGYKGNILNMEQDIQPVMTIAAVSLCTNIILFQLVREVNTLRFDISLWLTRWTRVKWK